jgi:hypothetical protein
MDPMKTLWSRAMLRAVVLLSILTTSFLSTAASAREPELIVYGDSGYRGSAQVFRGAVVDLKQHGFNDTISSVRIGGGAWLLCGDSHFRGRCEVFNRSVPDFDRFEFDNQVSSLRPVGWSEGAGWWRDPAGGGYGGIELFGDAGFRGRSRAFNQEIRDLRAHDLNDMVSSVRVRGGAWELCGDADFEGRCEVIAGSLANLSDLGFDNQVSSLRPVGWGGGGVWDRSGSPPPEALILFEDSGFRGDARPVSWTVPDLKQLGFNDQASSARVEQGAWELCADAYFQGHCVVVTDSVTDLRSLRLGDAVSSVRRLRR